MNLLKFKFFVSGLLLILGCKNYQSQELSKTYIAIGDSYTIGESVPEKEQWPRQLVTQLAMRGIAIKAPTIIAKTGWTTDELYAGIQQASLLASYDYVSLLIGVNNQYRGRSIEDFKPEIERLLKEAIRLSGNQSKNIFVLSIPDWGVTPFAEGQNREQIAQEIDQYNSAIKEACSRFNIAYFDITPISRRAISETELIAGDGLHPSGKMYQEWVGTLLPFFTSQP